MSFETFSDNYKKIINVGKTLIKTKYNLDQTYNFKDAWVCFFAHWNDSEIYIVQADIDSLQYAYSFTKSDIEEILKDSQAFINRGLPLLK